MRQEVKWSEDFNIGVEIVDKAHKKLFSIVRRVLLLAEDKNKEEWACTEGVKYFKTYTLVHFQEEEEYMRSIAYAGYAGHKRIHDNMREQVIPGLEQEMERSGYSRESMEHFLYVCISWLANHIMEVDKAITGKENEKRQDV